MTLAYIMKLSLTIQKTIFKARKIDGSSLKTYGLISIVFSIQDSLKKIQLFEEIFLLANINIKIVLGMFFLIFSNTNIKFAKLEKLTWRSYNTTKVLLTTSRVELIYKKEFAKVALNENLKILIVLVTI